jgi:alkanesulfonate monooxygenase SsuD/methylene tetrahydromethanopterin reductase-like flavin-dependent oxidoreductase (luciferase family)
LSAGPLGSIVEGLSNQPVSKAPIVAVQRCCEGSRKRTSSSTAESEARAKFEHLQDLIDPVVGLALLERMIGGFDLSGLDPDGPVPELPESNGAKSRQQLMFDLARREGLSLRQLYLRIAGARGHSQIVGTAVQIVDEMEARFRAGGADGFNIMPATLPGGLDDFIELVLPELRRRGLFRQDYEGRTLRGHLGSRPPPGFAPGTPTRGLHR